MKYLKICWIWEIWDPRGLSAFWEAIWHLQTLFWINLSFGTRSRYPSYRILSIPALNVTRVTASMSREARWWPSFWLVTGFICPSLIGNLSWLHPNPNLNLRYQLEPPGEGTPEGRPGRMHFADGLYFIWWQRCEALVLRLGKWGDGRDGKTWKSLTERRMLNYNSLFAWFEGMQWMQPPGPGEKFVKVEQTIEICKDNILLASFLFKWG